MRTSKCIACAIALLLFLGSVSIASCRSGSSDRCEKLGIGKGAEPPSGGSSSLTVVALIDLPNNQPDTTERVTRQVIAAVDDALGEEDTFALIGGVYFGDSTMVTPIPCMNGVTRSFSYTPGVNSQSTMQQNREKYLNDVQKQIAQTISTVSPKDRPTGDFRSLINWMNSESPSGSHSNVKVVMWSNFLANGNDCLHMAQSTPASDALANEIVQRCHDAGLIPSLGDADVEVIGAGYASDASLSAFSRQLATAFCPTLSSKCRVL